MLMTDGELGYLIGFTVSVSFNYALLLSLAAFIFNQARKKMDKTTPLKVKYVFIFTFSVLGITILGIRQPLSQQTFMFTSGLCVITILLAIIYYIVALVKKPKIPDRFL